MWHDDGSRQNRTRQSAQFESADRLVPGPDPSAASLVVQTVTQLSYPGAAGEYYAVKQVDVGGIEAEGGAATLSTNNGIFYALALPGSAVPASGDYLIIDSIGGRWCFST